jgi:hypothetical protein
VIPSDTSVVVLIGGTAFALRAANMNIVLLKLDTLWIILRAALVSLSASSLGLTHQL